MSAYKSDMAKAAITILLVVLLGIASYHFFPQSPIPREPFVFAWIEGNANYTDTMYKINKTLQWVMLDFEFAFVNGSSIHEPNANAQAGQSFEICLEYHGEFNATSLQRIGISRTGISFGTSCNTTQMEKNTTINTALKAVEVNDLGTFEELNWHETTTNYGNGCVSIGISGWPNQSYSGNWKRYGERDFKDIEWMMGIDQLSSMLPGSGIAWITFNATISVNIKYEITVDGTTETGETSLLYEGTIGTIEITYDQGRILWVKYDFQGARLQLLTKSE